MSSLNLTEGTIERICNFEEGLTAVLQLADIRLIVPVSHVTGAPERYRILLSDGRYSQQGMLATQMNGLVKSRSRQKGSVVELINYKCSQIQNHRIIIITELEVVQETCDIIGHPKGYPVLNPDDSKPPSKLQSSLDQPGKVSRNTPHGNLSRTAGPDFRPTKPGGPFSLLPSP